MKKRLWNGKVPWMLNVLHGNTNANKELLFFRMFVKKNLLLLLVSLH